jgi:Transposase C of IS166 homeodomain
MKTLATLPTHVPALQQLVLEQQHMIDTLTEQLRLSLRRQFGPRNETVNVDQLGLFSMPSSDDSTLIEIEVGTAEFISDDETTTEKAPVERKKAIRVLKDLPRDIRIIVSARKSAYSDSRITPS